MTRAKDISKIVTDADLSGTLDVTGTVTAGGLDIQGDGTISGGSRLTISDIADENNDGIRLDDSTTARFNNLTQDSSGNFKIQHWTGSAWQNNLTVTTGGTLEVTKGASGASANAAADELVLQNSGDAGLSILSPNANNSQILLGSPVANAGGIIRWTGDDNAVKIGTNNTGSTLRFHVGGFSEVMRISSAGSVGIGTSTIDSLLHLSKSDATAYSSTATDSQVGVGPTIYLENPANSNTSVGGQIVFGMRSTEAQARIGATGGSSPQLVFGTNDAEAMRIGSDGRIGVNTSNADAEMHIEPNSGGTNSSILLSNDGRTQYFRIQNNETNDALTINANDSNERMRIDASGNVLVGRTNNPSGVSNCIYALGNYGITTSSGANVFINSEGLFFRSTSSQRYKNTINDATHGLTELLTLRPVTYKGNNDADTVFGGLIAEEVHDAGLTEFVQYNDDGEPDALAYGHMVSLCIKAIQELKSELDSAKARITALENGE